jgi:hypothetical protein
MDKYIVNLDITTIDFTRKGVPVRNKCSCINSMTVVTFNSMLRISKYQAFCILVSEDFLDNRIFFLLKRVFKRLLDLITNIMTKVQLW